MFNIQPKYGLYSSLEEIPMVFIISADIVTDER